MIQDSALVPLTSSKKLTAIRKQAQQFKTPIDSKVFEASPSKPTSLLKESQDAIDAYINKIMATYSPGQKNKLFSIRYGEPEKIKQMSLLAIFHHFQIMMPKKFTFIETLNYFGLEPNNEIITKPSQFKAHRQKRHQPPL